MPSKSKGPSYYAVRKGRKPGVYLTWEECNEQVHQFSQPVFKKFSDLEEAEDWAGAKLVDPSFSSTPHTLGTAITSGSLSLTSTTRTKTASYVASSSTVKPIPRTTTSGSVAWPPSSSPSSSSPSSSGTTNTNMTSPSSSRGNNEVEWDEVFTDGACKGNQNKGLKKGPAPRAGLGVWWGPNDPRNVCERCPGDQTNNRAELIAIIRVLEQAPHTTKSLRINTDSQYSISCINDWLPNWRLNNFYASSGQPVKNAPLIKYLSALLDLRIASGQDVRLVHVKGHSTNHGNNMADQLAVRGSLLGGEVNEEGEMEDEDWDGKRKVVESLIEVRRMERIRENNAKGAGKRGVGGVASRGSGNGGVKRRAEVEVEEDRRVGTVPLSTATAKAKAVSAEVLNDEDLEDFLLSDDELEELSRTQSF